MGYWEVQETREVRETGDGLEVDLHTTLDQVSVKTWEHYLKYEYATC